MRFLENNFTYIVITVCFIFLLFELPIEKWYVILIMIAVILFLGCLFAFIQDFIYKIIRYFTKNKKQIFVLLNIVKSIPYFRINISTNKYQRKVELLSSAFCIIKEYYFGILHYMRNSIFTQWIRARLFIKAYKIIKKLYSESSG